MKAVMIQNRRNQMDSTDMIIKAHRKAARLLTAQFPPKADRRNPTDCGQWADVSFRHQMGLHRTAIMTSFRRNDGATNGEL